MSGLIESLDNALLTVGEDIRLRRTVGTGTNRSSTSVDIRAAVRAPSANEIVGTVQEGDLMCIFSPSEIMNAQWPGGHDPSNQDSRIPSKTAGDQVYCRGRWRSVEWTGSFYVGEEGLCRIEVKVRG